MIDACMNMLVKIVSQVGIAPGRLAWTQATLAAVGTAAQWTPEWVSAWGIAPYLTSSWRSGPAKIEPPWLTARN